MNNSEVEKAVKNRAEFGNHYLNKGKAGTIRCMRGIQAMCIQMMYQIGVYAFKMNKGAIRRKAGPDKGGSIYKVYSFLKNDLLKTVLGREFSHPKTLAKAIQRQFGYGMYCKNLYVMNIPTKKGVTKRKVHYGDVEDCVKDLREEFNEFREEMKSQYKETKGMLEKIMERQPKREETPVGGGNNSGEKGPKSEGRFLGPKYGEGGG